MTNERELREILSRFSIGLEIREYKKFDNVWLYPTRNKHIFKMNLTLVGKLRGISLPHLLWYCLGEDDFAVWQREAWEPFL